MGRANTNLKQCCAEAGISLRELAQKLGAHYSTVCGWAQGNTRPRSYQIERIATILNCDAVSLNMECYNPFRPHDEAHESIERRDMSEVQPLLEAIDECGYDCLRKVAAYVSAEALSSFRKRLCSGRLTDDEMKTAWRIVCEYRGDVQ